jgi:hypothetical protein
MTNGLMPSIKLEDGRKKTEVGRPESEVEAR